MVVLPISIPLLVIAGEKPSCSTPPPPFPSAPAWDRPGLSFLPRARRIPRWKHRHSGDRGDRFMHRWGQVSWWRERAAWRGAAPPRRALRDVGVDSHQDRLRTGLLTRACSVHFKTKPIRVQHPKWSGPKVILGMWWFRLHQQTLAFRH